MGRARGRPRPEGPVVRQAVLKTGGRGTDHWKTPRRSSQRLAGHDRAAARCCRQHTFGLRGRVTRPTKQRSQRGRAESEPKQLTPPDQHESLNGQSQAIVDTFSGKNGGPLGDLAGLLGEVLDVRRRRQEPADAGEGLGAGAAFPALGQRRHRCAPGAPASERPVPIASVWEMSTGIRTTRSTSPRPSIATPCCGAC
jgi:hypothetical protein